MPLYMLDIKVAATAYIRADSPEEALAIAKTNMRNRDIEVLQHRSTVPISGLRIDNPKLPDFSLSPMMTIKGYVAGSPIDIASE